MGICGSNISEAEKDARKRSQELEKKIQNDRSADERIIKLLFLGAGESGKSTLFKQMVSIYGRGWDSDDRKKFVGVIHGNIIEACKALCEASDNLHHAETKMSDQVRSSSEIILNLSPDAVLTPEIAQHMTRLWRDEGIQRTYQMRSHFQLIDSAEYFFEQLNQYVKPDYLASDQDILRARIRTTGIVEQDFVIEGNIFRMFDVGGQRNERKKWIHCFENVSCVLFVAALSEYDQNLFEDDTSNRMDEALHLFAETVNSQWFQRTNVVLFLNKHDLFLKKIKQTPLTTCFPEYNGTTDVEAANFVLNKFVSLDKSNRVDRTIYSHFTCATDRDQMKVVFSAVRDIVIRNNLREGGLLS